MSDYDLDVLVDVRDIFARIHDARVPRNSPLSATEMAAIRDCIRRINDLLGRAAPKDKKP